jgi:hypothetical protein
MLRDDTSGDADFKTLTIARFVRVFYAPKCSNSVSLSGEGLRVRTFCIKLKLICKFTYTDKLFLSA